MILEFEAKSAICVSAMGGKILQVTLDQELNDQDRMHRKLPCLLISRNFEFPRREALEWFDGKDYDAGGVINNLTVGEKQLTLETDVDMKFVIDFQLSEKEIRRLNSFLKRITRGRASSP